jgi:hypothetical protein
MADQSVLYVVSDAPYKKEHQDKVQQVRDYALTIDGFKEVRHIIREKNMGMHKSALNGIEEVLTTNNSFIILEDDIVVSPNFLQYMNDGLAYYKNDNRIFSISAFRPPFHLPEKYNKEVYFYPSNSPWGFATWKDRWEQVDFSFHDRYSELKNNKELYKKFMSIGFYIKGVLQADSKGEIEACDLRVYHYMITNNMCSVFPVVSKSQNWGFDGSGEHCNSRNAWWAKPALDMRNKPTEFILYTDYDKTLLDNQRKFQDKINGGIIAKYLKYTWIHKVYKKLKRIIR